MPALPGEKAALLQLIDSPGATLIKQGAEAKVFKATPFEADPPAAPLLLKYRFQKTYRHALLDAQLTKTRIAQEARCLVRAAKYGVCVPGVRCVDAKAGIIGLEWIDGQTVRDLLGGLPEDDEEDDEDTAAITNGMTNLSHQLEALALSEDSILSSIGVEIAKLHAADIVHGDLTTSNMMVRSSITGQGELVLIDFGLAHVSTMVEDKAVDLYVLERALISTHPEPEPGERPRDHQTRFQRILTAYAEHLDSKEWKKVGARLAEVQLRGRKRSMVG